MTWDAAALETLLGNVRNLQGRLTGALSALGFDVQSAAQLEAVTDEVMTSSAIEGVSLNADSVRSSVGRNLGIGSQENMPADHYVEELVQVAFDAAHRHNEPLTPERLFGWHCALFPTGRSGPYPIAVGTWRTGEAPMQVVSGAFGREEVHFEAPSSHDVPSLMEQFLKWVEDGDGTDPVIKAAVAHLWFVTIHPFDDGNGRITRTITDMLLARADGLPQRFYSMSKAIAARRREYYDVLERTQKGSLDITGWLAWFVDCLRQSLEEPMTTVHRTCSKVRFWDRHRDEITETRQVKVLNMLLDGRFVGKLTSAKYAKIAKCSTDTALRDITALCLLGILAKDAAGGRSTAYHLAEKISENN